MKIAILQDQLRNGGTERQSILLASQFINAGHNCSLVTFRPKGKLRAIAEEKNIPLKTLQPFDCGINFFAPGLIHQFRLEPVDIILCMGRMANARAKTLAQGLPQTKTISSVRTGKPLPQNNLKGAHAAHSIVVNSDWWKGELEKHNIASDKITVIPNGIVHDTKQIDAGAERAKLRRHYKVRENSIVFLSVAEFRSGKRQEQLIRYFADLPKQIDAQLWLVGEGEQRIHCQSIADKLSCKGQVKFIGFKEDPLPYYAAADIAVSASKEDALPNFLAEAQCMGLPVIAIDYRGVKECFLNKKSGLLVNDIKNDFKGAMHSLAIDNDQRIAMSQSAKAYAAERFDPKQSAKAHLQLFESLLTRK